MKRQKIGIIQGRHISLSTTFSMHIIYLRRPLHEYQTMPRFTPSMGKAIAVVWKKRRLFRPAKESRKNETNLDSSSQRISKWRLKDARCYNCDFFPDGDATRDSPPRAEIADIEVKKDRRSRRSRDMPGSLCEMKRKA